MKILITGINPVQCGHRPRLDYASSVLCVRWAMEQIYGQDNVDMRPVKVGEDLSGYDKVILYLAPIAGFVCRYTLGALWAIKTHEHITFSFDDWQIREIWVSFKNMTPRFKQVLEKNQFGWADADEAKPYVNDLDAIIAKITEWNLSNTLLVPAYPGGNLDLLHLPGKNVQRYNPAAFFRARYGELTDKEPVKNRRWTLAALHDHRSWLKKQKLTWSVDEFGHKKQGQPRLVEAELFQYYVKSWGVLSPAYYTCGSGWWRARHGFSADSLSIACGDPRELKMLGDLYDVTPAEVEDLSDSELTLLAHAQRDLYNYQTKADLLNDLTLSD